MQRTAPIGLALLWLVAGALPAVAGPTGRLPMRLRIEGYVGAPPAGVVALARWVVAVRAGQYRLTVTRLEPSPGANVAFWNILNALEPLPIAMTLMGNAATLARFTGTPPGQKIALQGSFQMQRGPSSLLLHSVDVLGTPVPAATPHPTVAIPTPPDR